MTYQDSDRHNKAMATRNKATDQSTARQHPAHRPNIDPHEPFIFKFTKGLRHGTNGLLENVADYTTFAEGTESHDPHAFDMVPPPMGDLLTEDKTTFSTLACEGDRAAFRQWESPTAGHAFVLEGPDPGAITMPPAPVAGGTEFAAEMAEVYQMALGREWSFAACMSPALINGLTKANGDAISNACKGRIDADHTAVDAAATTLSAMRWFQGQTDPVDTADPNERNRRRCGQTQTPGTLFRGKGEDGWDTPFLSQFMIMGTGGCPVSLEDRATGKIGYGAQQIDQRVRVAVPDRDYMMEWPEFVDVQNGMNARALATENGTEFLPDRRIMARLRDLATYVHDDQLYQAYLNAALIMLGEKAALDPGIPYHDNSGNPLSRANREPFALFGGPHLLTLVTEVSSRALKAVRLQKFTVHRRLRPEAAGALFHTVFSGYHPDRDIAGTTPYETLGISTEAMARSQLAARIAPYTHPYVNGQPTGSEPALDTILSAVLAHNRAKTGKDTWLLPMAFPEGSPMHPAYGAGHATVAGACVTLLKAFFNMSDPGDPTRPAYLVKPGETALVPDGGTSPSDCTIDMLGVPIAEGLTLEGELNKLIWNISNGRNIGGVHYYTDYIESALLGEAITIGILREQMHCYHPHENVSMTVPLLVKRTLPEALIHDADPSAKISVEAVTIRSDGTLTAAAPTPGRQ